MVRALFVFSICALIFSACTQRMVCPAFQSAYIYDKDELRKRFSYFQEDSTPKILTASKNKYLVAEPTPYRKKIRSMQTVAAKPVYVKLPDSLQIGDDAMMGEDGVVPGAELDMAARSVIDSIYIVDSPQDTVEQEQDSTYMISKDKELRFLKYDYPDSLIYDPATGKYVPETPRYVVTEITFNVDQDNYMWYLRDYLVLPDVKLAHQKQSVEKAAEKKKKKEKKGFFGFFKNLFKKKNRDQNDSTLTEPEKPKEEFDFIDEEQEQIDPLEDEITENKDKRKRKDEELVASSVPDKPVEKTRKKKKEKKAVKTDEEPAVEEPIEEEIKPVQEEDGF